MTCDYCSKGCDGRGGHGKNGCDYPTNDGQHCDCPVPQKPRLEEFTGDHFLWKKISNAGEMKTSIKRLMDDWERNAAGGIRQMYDVSQALEAQSKAMTDERKARKLAVRARQLRHVADEFQRMESRVKKLVKSMEDYLNTGVEA